MIILFNFFQRINNSTWTFFFSLQFFDDFYHFEHRHVSKRSISPSSHHQSRLNDDDRVHWSLQQRAKSRQKRDYRPLRMVNSYNLNDPKWPEMWYLVGWKLKKSLKNVKKKQKIKQKSRKANKQTWNGEEKLFCLHFVWNILILKNILCFSVIFLHSFLGFFHSSNKFTIKLSHLQAIIWEFYHFFVYLYLFCFLFSFLPAPRKWFRHERDTSVEGRNHWEGGSSDDIGWWTRIWSSWLDVQLRKY